MPNKQLWSDLQRDSKQAWPGHRNSTETEKINNFRVQGTQKPQNSNLPAPAPYSTPKTPALCSRQPRETAFQAVQSISIHHIYIAALCPHGASGRCSESLWALATSDFEISTTYVVDTQLNTVGCKSQGPKKPSVGQETDREFIRGAQSLWGAEPEDRALGFRRTSWWWFHLYFPLQWCASLSFCSPSPAKLPG